MDGRVPAHPLDGELEGLDEAQRAEVHEYEGGGPSDGSILTDMTRDRGEDYVEDTRANEILGEPLGRLGMNIVSPEDLGDEVLDGDAAREMDGDLDDEDI